MQDNKSHESYNLSLKDKSPQSSVVVEKKNSSILFVIDSNPAPKPPL